MVNRELEKSETKALQGIAILMMLFLHLFDRHDFDGIFSPSFFIKGIPVTYFLAQLSDCCVMLYAFCSGYGHYASMGNTKSYKKRLNKLFLFFINYWIALTLFVIIGIVLKSSYIPGNIIDIMGNYTGLYESYNASYWYVAVYALLVIISPFILKCIKKNTVLVFVITGILYCIGYAFRYEIFLANPIADFVITKAGKFLMTLFEYSIGTICSKEKYISKIAIIFDKVGRKRSICFISCVLIVITYVHGSILQNMIFAPINGIIIIIAYKYIISFDAIKKVFLYFGTHSTNIWFVHFYFCTNMFGNSVYYAKYPLFIYLLLIALSLFCSYIINIVYKPIRQSLVLCRKDRLQSQ